MSTLPLEEDSRLQAEGLESFTFADVRIRPGDRLQLQLPPALGSERPIVRLIGYLEPASLMVTHPVLNGQRVPFREEDKIVARVFTSQKAFAFDTYVIRTCTIPYPYLHLSFPTRIQGSVIRKSPRVKMTLKATIGGPAIAGKTHFPVQITNLSADGALVRAPEGMWGKGQDVTLAFQVRLHHVDAKLEVEAIIRSIVQEASREGGDDFGYSHGLQFINVGPNDRMILQGLIYQQMIEQPNTVI